MRRYSRRLLASLLVVLVDVLIIFDAFAVAYLLRFQYQLALDRVAPAPPLEYLKAMVVVAYTWLLLLKIHGLYDFSRIRSSIDIVHLIFRAISFGTLISLALSYFYREFTYSRLVSVYAWGISLVLFSVFRVSLNRYRMRLYREGEGVRRALIVGGRSLASFLVDRIRQHPEMGLRIVGAIDDDPPAPDLGCGVLGRIDDLTAVVRDCGVETVLIAHPAIGHESLLRVIHECEQLGVPLRMVPPTFDLTINHRDFQEIDGIPLVSVTEKERRSLYEVGKRTLDVAASALAVVGLVPVWLLVALLIRLEDGGPVLFFQERVGRDGRVFRMLKFRTMVVHAEALLPQLVNIDALPEPVFKLERDPRVTRVGRILRRASLDELPQLLNVLSGEMSLVGPRPEERRVVERYGIWERRRLKAKPGITGLQQIECRGSTSLRERVRQDIVYLRKRTLLLDVWICLKTVWVVLRGRGAR